MDWNIGDLYLQYKENFIEKKTLKNLNLNGTDPGEPSTGPLAVLHLHNWLYIFRDNCET